METKKNHNVSLKNTRLVTSATNVWIYEIVIFFGVSSEADFGNVIVKRPFSIEALISSSYST